MSEITNVILLNSNNMEEDLRRAFCKHGYICNLNDSGMTAGEICYTLAKVDTGEVFAEDCSLERILKILEELENRRPVILRPLEINANINKNFQRRISRALRKRGYILKKAHPNWHYEGVPVNYGGYMIVDEGTGDTVAGPCFELDLCDVERLLDKLMAKEM